VAALLISLLLAAMFGALLECALRGDAACHPLERVGRALTFGLGGLGALGMLADVTGLGVSRASVGALLVLSVLGLLIARRRAVPSASTSVDDASRAVPVGGWASLSAQARVAVVGMFALAAVALVIQVRAGWIRPTYQFDALMRWMFKAKALAHEGTLFGAFSYDEIYGFTHQRYPPLVSHVANLPALVSGVFDDYVASAMFPWFAVALVCLGAGAVARRAGLLSGALVAAWIANLPLIAFIDNPPPGAGSWSAMADIPLALFVCASGLALLDLVQGGRPRAALNATVCLALATLTKNEAMPLLAGATLALLLSLRAQRWRVTAQVVGGAALVFVLLWGHRIPGIPALDENYHGQLGLAQLVAGVDRLGLILMGTEIGSGTQQYRMPGVLPEMLSFRSWNLTWPLVVLLWIAAGRRALDRGGRVLLLLVVVQLAAYVGAYMVTAWESPNARALVGADGDPLAFLLNLTLGRLLLHVAPLAICAGLILNPLRTSRSG